MVTHRVRDFRREFHEKRDCKRELDRKKIRDMKILSYPPSRPDQKKRNTIKFLQPPKNTPKPVTSKSEST